MAAVQGAFFGSNLPAARIEGLIAAHIPRKEIVGVAASYGTKWWDYRRLTPGHSFLLFAHHYYKAYKISARKVLAERARQKASTRNQMGAALIGVANVQFSVEEIWDRDKGHLTGMWNAMLMADELGIPYDTYCRLGNQAAIDGLWKRLPRPSHLYGNKIGAALLNSWETLSRDRLFTAKHPLYSLDNYAGLPVQDAYQEWLIEQLKERGDPTTALATVVYRSPQLPEAKAKAEFPATALNRARLMAN